MIPLAKEILDAIDLDAARDAIKKLDSQIETMSYAPPEGMAEQLRMVAGHMNELAVALCLHGPPKETD